LYNTRNPRLGWGDVPSSVAPYVPSPIKVVKMMLKLAGANEEDVLYDLGCGDGRILFTAIQEFGVNKAIGYDLNAKMCKSLMLKVEERGLSDCIEVHNGNFFLADLNPATIVTLYLTTSGNSKLRPKLEKELKQGSRVVSHDFPINSWISEGSGMSEHYSLGSHKIYLYKIPIAYKQKNRPEHSQKKDGHWRRLKNLFLGPNRGSNSS
jgi:hypothetical protein